MLRILKYGLTRKHFEIGEVPTDHKIGRWGDGFFSACSTTISVKLIFRANSKTAGKTEGVKSVSTANL
jgi:hypothetical protein